MHTPREPMQAVIKLEPCNSHAIVNPGHYILKVATINGLDSFIDKCEVLRNHERDIAMTSRSSRNQAEMRADADDHG